MGYRVDEIALPPVEIDLLDTPNEIQNHSCQDEQKHDRTDTQKHPIDIRAFLTRDRTKDIEQHPPNREPNQQNNHDDRKENWPLQTFAFKHGSRKKGLIAMKDNLSFLFAYHPTGWIDCEFLVFSVSQPRWFRK